MEEQAQIKELSLPLYQVKRWMKILGVMMMVSGVIIASSIIGILIAWMPIWLGILLFQAVAAVERAQTNGDKNQFVASMMRLKTYFLINGVLMLVMFICAIPITVLVVGSLPAMMDAF